MVGGETRQRLGICKRSRAMWYCFFLCPSRPGGWFTLAVAEAEEEIEVGENIEEVKSREDKV